MLISKSPPPHIDKNPICRQRNNRPTTSGGRKIRRVAKQMALASTWAILHFATIERSTTGANGGCAPLIAGSTRSVASTVTHAGICNVKRYPSALTDVRC
jgi:hypothetical protein